MEDRTRLASVYAIAIVIASPLLYLLLNGSAISQMVSTPLTILAMIMGGGFVLALVYRLFSFRTLDGPLATLLITIIFIATAAVYFQSFFRVLFIPNTSVNGATSAGNPLGGLLGFVIMWLTGYHLALLLTGRRLLSLSFAVATGGGVVALETLALALAGFLYPLETVVASLGTLFGLMIASNLRPRRRGSVGKQPQATGVLPWLKNRHVHFSLLVVLPFMAIVALQSIAYPPTEWDSLAYGLPYASLIFGSHGIPLISGPSIGLEISANYPPGMQLLAAYFYSFTGGVHDLYYRILSPIFSVSVIATTYVASRSVFGKARHGFLAVAALSSFPLFWTFAALTSYIMFTTAEFSAVMLSLILWRVHAEERYLVLAGVISGFAALTSYIGFFAFLFPVASIVVVDGLRRNARRIAVVLISGSFSGVWLIRNYSLLGNPLYPLGGLGLNLVPELIQSTETQIRSVFPPLPPYKLVSYFVVQGGNLTPGPLFLFVAASSLVMGVLLLPRRLKPKDRTWFQIPLLVASSSCFLFMIFVLNGYFIRYLTIFLPAFALQFVLLYRTCESLNLRFARVILVIALLTGLVFSAALVETNGAIPGQRPLSESQYIAQFYGNDGLAWNWINQNTPRNAVVATFDIRTYYINRTVIPLDGYELKTLYTPGLSEAEVFRILQGKNVSYIFSAGWASAISSDAPPAYNESSLTKYLGDPDYFSTVYANPDDAIYAVKNNTGSQQPAAPRYVPAYSVDPLSTQQVYSVFVNNSTIPPTSMVYLSVPPDFAGDLLSISARAPSNISVELWQGQIPKNYTTGWWHVFRDMERSPGLHAGVPLGSTDPAFVGLVTPGYYTLVVADWSNRFRAYNATVDVSVLTRFGLQSLSVSPGSPSHFGGRLNFGGVPYSVLYFKPNSTGLVELGLPVGGRYAAFELFNTTVPFNGYSGWDAGYGDALMVDTAMMNRALAEMASSVAFVAQASRTYSLVVLNQSSSTDFGALEANVSTSISFHQVIVEKHLLVSPAGRWSSAIAGGVGFHVAERNATSYSDFVVSSQNANFSRFSLQISYLDSGKGNVTFYAVDGGHWIEVFSITLTGTGSVVNRTITDIPMTYFGSLNRAYFVIDTFGRPFYVAYVEAQE